MSRQTWRYTYPDDAQIRDVSLRGTSMDHVLDESVTLQLIDIERVQQLDGWELISEEGAPLTALERAAVRNGGGLSTTVLQISSDSAFTDANA